MFIRLKCHQKSCFYHGLIIKPLANTCQWRAPLTQLAGSLATTFLAMTSVTQRFGLHGTCQAPWQPCQRGHLCWCFSQDCHSRTPLLSPIHVGVWIQDCPSLSLFLPRCAPFFAAYPCTTSVTLLICCLERMDPVTYRIQPVDRTAWISAKAEIFLFR